MSTLEARILTESEYTQWDQLVNNSEMGTIFHSSKWITTVSKSLYLNFIIIGVFDDSQLIGGCFFYIKNQFNIFKIGYTSVPLTPFGGFVITAPNSKNVRKTEELQHEIISLVLKKIKTLNLFIVKLTNSPSLIDIRPMMQQGWKGGIYYTYIISLENDIYSNVGKNIRVSIRKAQKIGIKVKKEYNPDIFWRLTELTYGKQNLNVPFKKEYLFNIMEMLIQNNLGEMWIAEMPSGEVASAVFVVFDSSHSTHGWLGSSDPKFISTGVVSFIHFELFMDLQSRGFHSFNIMGGNIPHLSKFFSSFNPKLVPYYTVVKIKWLEKIFNLDNSPLKKIWK